MSDNKVNFLIAGAQKSGTSAVDYYLRKHPHITMAKRKECHFFDKEKYATNNYKMYHRLFNNFDSKLLKGECTPIYMYWPNSIERIYNYNPNIKIIALLRNPINRAFSAWNMLRNLNIEKLSFSEAIRTEQERICDEDSIEKRLFSYIDRGFYSEQIKNIWHFFPKEQTLFLKYDDFKKDFIRSMHEITHFLDVDSFKNLEFEIVNKNEYTENIKYKDWDYLKNIFKDEINKLELLLNWDCKDWTKY